MFGAKHSTFGFARSGGDRPTRSLLAIPLSVVVTCVDGICPNLHNNDPQLAVRRDPEAAEIKCKLEKLTVGDKQIQHAKAIAEEEPSLHVVSGHVVSGNQFVDDFTAELRKLLESASMKVRQLVIVESK